MTELLLAHSFENLKRSAVRASSRSLRSVGGKIREHPVAVAGAAAGAGILLFLLFRLISRGSSSDRGGGSRETARPDIAREIISMLVPVVTPYVTSYVRGFMERKFSRGRE